MSWEARSTRPGLAAAIILAMLAGFPLCANGAQVDPLDVRSVGKAVPIDARARRVTRELLRQSLAKEHLFGVDAGSVQMEQLSARYAKGVVITCGVTRIARPGQTSTARPFWIWSFVGKQRTGQSDVTVAESFKTVQGRSLAQSCRLHP